MGQSNINNLSSEFRASRDSTNTLVPSRSITVSTAQNLVVAALDDATTKVLFSVETATCYVTWDGTTPTATNGHPITAGQSTEWNRFLAIDAKIFCATSARVHLSEFQTK
jgi:hypothetical protein